jgi:hypothetical protein
MAKKKKKMNVTPNVLLNITWQKYEYLFFFNKKNECHPNVLLNITWKKCECLFFPSQSYAADVCKHLQKWMSFQRSFKLYLVKIWMSFFPPNLIQLMSANMSKKCECYSNLIQFVSGKDGKVCFFCQPFCSWYIFYHTIIICSLSLDKYDDGADNIGYGRICWSSGFSSFMREFLSTSPSLCWLVLYLQTSPENWNTQT